ncbi:MAG TPA: DUF6118 family protein [Sphingomonas sp.]|nr:DUF6118 family protein [Sphingomonas sp.]
MDQDRAPDMDTSLAAHAFGELRAEVSLLRRAVERLTDERTSQPDYAPSLEAISKRLEDVCGWAQKVSERPALKLTPESLGREIVAASKSSREQDRAMLERAAGGMDAATDRIDAILERARSAAAQKHELLHNRIAFAVAGIALFAILPGPIARALPASWAIPERMATRTLGTDMWNGGQRLMGKADPERWHQVVARNHQCGRERRR